MENEDLVELTQEIVRELLDYDPEKGILTWRERDAKWFKDGKQTMEHKAKRWNSRYANKVAGTFCKKRLYGQIILLNKRCMLHRIIWLWMTGEWPNVIDHENGVPSDNRWINLRSVSDLENSKNVKLSSRNKSGYKGVSWDENRGCWVAQIKSKDKSLFLGRFEKAEEAFAVYAEKATEFGFSNRHIYGDTR